MVELVTDLGRRHVADNLGIRRRFRIDIDDCDAVGRFSVGIEGRDIGERFGRRLRRLARRGVKTWIRRPGGHVILSSRDWLTSPCPGLGSIAQACCGRRPNPIDRITYAWRPFEAPCGICASGGVLCVLGIVARQPAAPPRHIEPGWALTRSVLVRHWITAQQNGMGARDARYVQKVKSPDTAAETAERRPIERGKK